LLAGIESPLNVHEMGVDGMSTFNCTAISANATVAGIPPTVLVGKGETPGNQVPVTISVGGKSSSSSTTWRFSEKGDSILSPDVQH
jgi:hypothetical protein